MPELTIQQAIDLALKHHQSGQLHEAEQLYWRILRLQPENALTLHNLGLLMHQTGKNDTALDLLRHAINVKPDWFEAYVNLAAILQKTGRLTDAISVWRQAAAQLPNHPQVYLHLGMVLKAHGELDESIVTIQQAIALKPAYAEAYNNLGMVLQARGQLDQAIGAYRQAIAFAPNLLEVHNNLAGALQEKGQLEDAITILRGTVALRSNSAEIFYNLALLLKENQQCDEAIVACRQAISLKPDFAEAHNDLAGLLGQNGRYEDAIAAARHAIALRPDFAAAYQNLSSALINNQQIDQGIAAAQQAIVIAPDYMEPHINLAAVYLLRGNFARGWDEYEYRRRQQDFSIPEHLIGKPQWDGSPLPGRTLLVYTEQGFGDAIQFARYVPLLQQRGGRIILECQHELHRLFLTLGNDFEIVVRGQAIPSFDCHCPLLSLPRLFGTTVESIPCKIPYLHADALLIDNWRERIATPGEKLKVGLLWAGNPKHMADQKRSLTLDQLAPLENAAGVKFYSLQKGPQAGQVKQPPNSMLWIDLGPYLNNFADTAAAISLLDLIIAPDTAIAHLAGALGKPIWTLLPRIPDWRWLLDRDDSPWYPSMRLFRQPSPGDWDSVIKKISKELKKY